MWIVIIIVVLGGGYWLMKGSAASVENPAPVAAVPTVPAVPTDAGVPAAATTATVSYDGAAFTPAEVTVKKGSTVTFTSTGPDMWVATAMHPDHKGYAGTTLKEHCPDTTDTAFDQCAVGATYTTKFEKVGTWPYHNHVKGGVYGKVIVVE